MLRVILLVLFASFAYAEEDLEQRVNELTNQIEQINHKYDVLAKKFESLSQDVEFRFKEKENQPKPSPAKTEAAVKTPADPKLAKAEFEQAYALLKEQQYEEAEKALDLFIKNYPNSEYTGAAYYWLGESFMLRKRYDKAAIHYLQSFSKFPKNNKADLSMLKLASALNSLNQKKESCALLAKLKTKSASLTPAIQKLIQTEVAKIKCKG